MRRLVVGLVLPVLLVTAACSGSGSSTPVKVVSLAAVKVSGPTTAAPVVNFTAPIAFAATSHKVIVQGPGTGPAVTSSSLVTVRYVAINASDESVFGTTWKSKPATFYVNTVVKGFTEGLIGTHVGDRVLIGSQAKDAYGVTGNLASTVRPGDSVIFVVDVVKVFAPKTMPASVPTLTYDSSGNPAKFTAGSGVPTHVTKLGVYPVVEGPGPVVKSGDTINVDYFGQIYPAASVFNAWTGQPFSAQLGAGQVIPGWDQGLVGQRVGSRVVLVIPPSLGYKNKAKGPIPANSTLIFVVQIVSVN